MQQKPLAVILKQLLDLKSVIEFTLSVLLKKIDTIDQTELQIELIDRKELMQRLNLSEATIAAKVRKGVIPEIKIDYHVRYNWQAVVTALEQHTGVVQEKRQERNQRDFSYVKPETELMNADVSVRLFNILVERCPLFKEKRGETPVSVLSNLSKAEFLTYKNSGMTTLDELRELCTATGIELLP